MIRSVAQAAEAQHLFRESIDAEAFHWRMRHDPQWAAAVSYAAQHGIPFGEFMGDPLPGPGETRWSLEDRQLAIAWQRWKAAVCSGCGLHPLDWPEERDETWKGTVETCFGCAELGDTTAGLPDDLSDEKRRALKVTLVPRSERERVLLDAHEAGEIDLEPDDLP